MKLNIDVLYTFKNLEKTESGIQSILSLKPIAHLNKERN
jgi:hypothetical protein